MDWLSNNWIWLIISVGALAFLAFGRGACSISRGGHDQRRQEAGDGSQPDRNSSQTLISATPTRMGSTDRATQSSVYQDSALPPTDGAVTTQHADHANASGQGGTHKHRHSC